MLQKVQPQIVGSFSSFNSVQKLEDFHVPPNTLSRKNYGGICEDAQKYLSDFVSQDESFLTHFDDFVENCILPGLKARLRKGKSNDQIKTDNRINDQVEYKEDFKSEEMKLESETTVFYYQRPPTLRLQPGPSRASVKMHRDSDYGHQEGELNYWVPLTNPDLTKVTIWTESSSNEGDYHPLNVKYGEVAIFHGSSCRHFVPMNTTKYTRMSLDFRVGIEGFFDSGWMMEGTTDDHNRRRVEI